jgi:hypothetical protein
VKVSDDRIGTVGGRTMEEYDYKCTEDLRYDI